MKNTENNTTTEALPPFYPRQWGLFAVGATLASMGGILLIAQLTQASWVAQLNLAQWFPAAPIVLPIAGLVIGLLIVAISTWVIQHKHQDQTAKAALTQAKPLTSIAAANLLQTAKNIKTNTHLTQPDNYNPSTPAPTPQDDAKNTPNKPS